jgi:hypothetical protein
MNVELDGVQARLIALDRIIVAIQTDGLPGWDEYPMLTERAWERVDAHISEMQAVFQGEQYQVARHHNIDLDALLASTED